MPSRFAPADPLAVLDQIPRDLLPAALARLAARAMEPVPPADDRVLTPREVSGRLGVHVKWFYRHVDQLGGERLGPRTLRFPAAVARYLEALTIPSITRRRMTA